MPKQELDNELKADLDVRASLEQRRDGIMNGLKDAANYHAQQRQELQGKHDQIVSDFGVAHDQTVASVIATQRSQLESSQKSQIELINKALAAASRMEKGGPDGPRQALQLINDAADLNGSLAESNKQRQKAEIDELKMTLAISDAAPRNEKIEELIRGQQDAAELLNRDMKVATAALERRESLVQNVLNKGQLDRLRTIATETVDNEKLRALFTDQVLQRLADEALHPGSERLEHVDEDQAVQRVKGEIAERIAGAQALQEIEQENKTRAADRRLFLIEGDRIRNELGKKMSDGLIVWRDAENKLQIWKALEVKSGPHAARELNSIVEKLTKEQDQELRKYAIDEARDAVEKEKGLTATQLRVEIQRLGKEEEANLRSRGVQKEAGQREKTTERLDLTERIYVDGRAHQATVDREHRLDEVVKKVTTDDAIKKDLEVQRLGLTSRDLELVSEAFVEELLRK